MGLFAIIGWIIFGFIVGAIARFLLPGEQRMGWIMTTVLGVVGSFVGGGIWWVIFNGQGAMEYGGFVTATLGAMLVLYLYTKFVPQS